jgi:hypothetical protein
MPFPPPQLPPPTGATTQLPPPISHPQLAPLLPSPTAPTPQTQQVPVLVTAPSARRNHTGLWVSLAAVIAVGGGGLYIYSTASPDRPTLTTAATTTLAETAESTPPTVPSTTIPPTTVVATTVVETTVPPTTVVQTTVAETVAPQTTIAVVVEPPAPVDPATLIAPADGFPYTAPSGWKMQIGPSWATFDIPNFTEEVAWATGSAAVGSSIVNVISETPAVDLDITSYLAQNVTGLTQISPQGVISSQVSTMPDGRQLGRIEYIATFGTELHFVVYITKSQASFVVVTFGTKPELFATEAAAVEPYLATLTPAVP